MQRVHDLGGREGFGRVEREPDEPVFRSPWERRAFGVTMGTFVMGLSNGGQFRHAIERMDPQHYLDSPYYEHWITASATRLVETGRVDHAELERRAGGVFPLSLPETAPAVEDDDPNATVEPRFAVGDRVRVRAIETTGHTRAPGYLRSRVGTVVRVDPATPLSDVEAHSPDGRAHKEPQYCVRFDGPEPNTLLHADLFDSYLEEAG